MVHLDICNHSAVKRLYRRKDLLILAENICHGEGLIRDAEISLVLCDDPFIQELNLQYRKKDKATDVLSFQQEVLDSVELIILGDIVISLETVERFCHNDRDRMRQEVRLLFCHGLLHLLGYTHGAKKDRLKMTTMQAKYLGVEVDQAWHS